MGCIIYWVMRDLLLYLYVAASFVRTAHAQYQPGSRSPPKKQDGDRQTKTNQFSLKFSGFFGFIINISILFYMQQKQKPSEYVLPKLQAD